MSNTELAGVAVVDSAVCILLPFTWVIFPPVSVAAASADCGKLFIFVDGTQDSGEKIAWWSNPELLVHRGAGCDFCGMYPIIGDRYRCADCEESIGFDLCGDCYKNRSKRPGRFNQKHTPDHKFELIEYRRMLISRGQDSTDLIVIPDDPASSSDEDENQTDSDATN